MSHSVSSSSRCSLATVANSNSGVEADQSMGGGDSKEKMWERPWSITQLRDSSRNWTLASDAGVSGEGECFKKGGSYPLLHNE